MCVTMTTKNCHCFVTCLLLVFALTGCDLHCPISNLCIVVSYCNTTTVISVNQRNATVLVPQNVNVTLQCSFHKSLGFIYKEIKNNRLIKMGSPLTFTLVRVRWPQDAVTYGCSKYSDIGPSFILDITVPPTVFDWSVGSLECDLGSTAQFNCSMYGNPTPAVRWVKMAKYLPTNFTLRNDVLNGYAIHMIESHLVINVNSTESYGNYSCQANNTVGTAERAFELMPLELPQVKMDPEILSLVNTGNYISIICHVTGVPLPIVSWRRNSSEVTETKISSIRAARSGSTYILSQLHLVNVSKFDSGCYTCSAVIGPYSESQRIRIIVIGVPHKPRNVTVYNVTSHSVNISFSVSVDVSAPVTNTTVWIRTGNGSLWGKAKETRRAGIGKYVLINGLRPFTLYQVRLASSNEVGTSGFSPIIEFMTDKTEPTNPPVFTSSGKSPLSSHVFNVTTGTESTLTSTAVSTSRSSTALQTELIASTVSVAGVVISTLLIIAIYCFRRRRIANMKLNDVSGSPTSSTKPTSRRHTATTNILFHEHQSEVSPVSSRPLQAVLQDQEDTAERTDHNKENGYGKFVYSEGSCDNTEDTQLAKISGSKDRPIRVPDNETSFSSSSRDRETREDYQRQVDSLCFCASGRQEKAYGKFGYPCNHTEATQFTKVPMGMPEDETSLSSCFPDSTDGEAASNVDYLNLQENEHSQNQTSSHNSDQ